MYRAAVKDAVPCLASFLKTFAATPNIATLPVLRTAAQELLVTSPLRSHVGNRIGRMHIFGQHLNGSACPRSQLPHLNQQLLQIPAALSDVRTHQILRTCAFQASVDNSIGQSPSTHPIAYGTVREQHSSAMPQAEGVSAPQAVKTVQSESGGDGGQKSDGGARKGFFANLQDVPLVPLLLGFAGAIPFVALAPPVAPLLPLPEDVYRWRADWHAAYGAVIASFLGAVHWGLAMAEHGHRGAIASFSIATLRYTWGVIPALLAWPALLLPPAEKFAALSGVIGLAFLVDAGFAQFKLLPKWYMPLRLSLTVLAVGGLASSWSVAAVKSTYNRSRTHVIDGKEGQLPGPAANANSKVL